MIGGAEGGGGSGSSVTPLHPELILNPHGDNPSRILIIPVVNKERVKENMGQNRRTSLTERTESREI